jgi:hypothetical protein
MKTNSKPENRSWPRENTTQKRIISALPMNRVAPPVPAASRGSVPLFASTPGGTPGELAGEDACATLPTDRFRASKCESLVRGILAPTKAEKVSVRTGKGLIGVHLCPSVVKLLCGLCVLLWHSALAEVHYVDVNNTNATPPYTNWATAATNIQDAVDAAAVGDEIVVTNGTYVYGGRDSSRVKVDKPLTLRSVNGPQFTAIEGDEANRCAYLASNASLSGFTLSYGSANNGGGVFGESASAVASNCALTDNMALGPYAAHGGGAANCTLNNCVLTGNRAASTAGAHGGGAYFCTLNTCTLTGNFAYEGAGADFCTLNNCIVYYNEGANYYGGVLNNCCTIPMPVEGAGNITNAPLFVDTNGWANLRLQSNSPCINAGNNSYVTNATDLDGNPRISSGTVDIGAYEFQWPQLTIALSGPNVLLRWPTNNAGYDYTGFTLQSTTNLGASAVWRTNSPAPVVIGGQNTVTNPVTSAQKLYRLANY